MVTVYCKQKCQAVPSATDQMDRKTEEIISRRHTLYLHLCVKTVCARILEKDEVDIREMVRMKARMALISCGRNRPR